MKKFIAVAFLTTSWVASILAPFAIARAQVKPQNMLATENVDTTGTSAGTTVLQAQVPDPVATDTIVSVLTMRVTAYASVPDETDSTPFITADGTEVADGIAASNILPFGTRIEIPALFGNEVFTIHDRMSTKIKNTIDIWMGSVHQAIIFGAQHASILVLASSTTSNLAIK